MKKLLIKGGNRLQGTVRISGAKNATLPLMVASILTDEEVTFSNVPHVSDIATMVNLLVDLGVDVTCDGTDEDCGNEGRVLIFNAKNLTNHVASYELVSKMRASIFILGPLLARLGKAKVSLPGGCAIGTRPVDLHLKAMEKLGAKIKLNGGYIEASVDGRLKGTEINFEKVSVGATENTMMAASLAEGQTILNNSACEPEIIDLAKCLNSMGAKITGLNTNILTIDGVTELHPTEITVIPDRIEAGTFLMAGVALGDITLNHAEPSHLQTVLDKLEECGASYTTEPGKIHMKKADEIIAIDVTTEVYPGFPTDLQAQWMALMCSANGESVVTDTVYHDRFTHIPELNRLGAKISLHDNVATIEGVKSLKGAQVMSTDIRASASLILAGLMADGQTDVSRIYHIDRGYEKIEDKFSTLNAEIIRVSV